MYYLGIDGGGTKTKYLLINNELIKVAEVEGSTIHIHQVGVEGIKTQITENVAKICNEANIDVTDIAYVFVGIAGYGESIEDVKKIDKAFNEIMEVPYSIENDAVNGWAGGTACKPGINVVAGTGSIAYGRNSNGKLARCGGFGPGIGDDGSAYWIALKTINEYTKQKDGRKEKTLLVDILEKEYGITYRYEIVDIIFNRLKFNRTEIAKFSTICFLAAENGCSACKEIFREAAEAIFAHIKAISKELNLTKDFIVSYTGGVFKAGKYVLEPLQEMIKESGLECHLKEPTLEPWHGSALLAYTLGGNVVPDNVAELLK